MDRQQIVAFHQHMPSPLTYADYEKLDLEICWGLPLTKHLEDALLGVFVV